MASGTAAVSGLLYPNRSLFINCTSPGRIGIYLVSHGSAAYTTYSPKPRDGLRGHEDIVWRRAQGPACCPRSAICGDDQQAADVALSLCFAV